MQELEEAQINPSAQVMQKLLDLQAVHLEFVESKEKGH